MQKIVILGTGGTIAGAAPVARDNLGYRAAQLDVAQLLAAVAGLEQAARGPLQAEQVAQVDSKDMDFVVWRALALRCAACLQAAQVRGIVITHGTDTLEETAWFLSQVLPAAKPVVLTGAMRPATALAPDGPQNLRDAVALAASPGAQGVLAVAAGVIHGAHDLRKLHPYRLDAFGSGDAGPLGWMEEGAVRWAQNKPVAHVPPAQAALEWIASSAPWPRVEIVMSHAGASAATVDALVASGVRGLVVAATGNGTVHRDLLAGLLRAQAAGVAVVRASRCAQGRMLAQPGDALPAMPGLSPVKARISLMLELMRA